MGVCRKHQSISTGGTGGVSEEGRHACELEADRLRKRIH